MAWRLRDSGWWIPCCVCLLTVVTACKRSPAASGSVVMDHSVVAAPAPVALPSVSTGSPAIVDAGKTSDVSKPSGESQKTSCRSYADCFYDAQGQCRAPGSNESAHTYLDPGPFCDCTAGLCEIVQVPEIACKTDQDCWVSNELPHRPIRRPAHLRGRKFRPCVDGEVPPRCFGICKLSLVETARC
jgi:hypothetical protein